LTLIAVRKKNDMKTKLIYILTIWLYACGPTTNETTISIIDYRNSKAPSVNADNHKNKDVEIFRTIFLTDTYSSIMYRFDNGKLRGYQTYFESSNNYDKATYKWINDSTLTFKLINSSNNLTESYTVTGYKSTTGVTRNK
jgi:hypothetical protein